MPESFVRVAPDSTGAKMRVRERVIGADTVEEQIVVQENMRVASGVFIASPASQVIQAAAHAANLGFLALFNRSAAQMIEVRRVEFVPFRPAVTVFPTAPEITLERFSYTGTPNGTLTTPAKSVRTTQNGETADANSVGELRVPGGATITAGDKFHRFVHPATLIVFAAGTQATDIVVPQMYRPSDDDGRMVLANGEGMMIRQDTAATASDTRRFLLNIAWTEYTIP
jgi:hypothetical protein